MENLGMHKVSKNATVTSLIKECLANCKEMFKCSAVHFRLALRYCVLKGTDLHAAIAGPSFLTMSCLEKFNKIQLQTKYESKLLVMTLKSCNWFLLFAECLKRDHKITLLKHVGKVVLFGGGSLLKLFQACIAKCEQNEKCEAINFQEKSRTCWLKPSSNYKQSTDHSMALMSCIRGPK